VEYLNRNARDLQEANLRKMSHVFREHRSHEALFKTPKFDGSESVAETRVSLPSSRGWPKAARSVQWTRPMVLIIF
jgi:hypothetical protein